MSIDAQEDSSNPNPDSTAPSTQGAAPPRIDIAARFKASPLYAMMPFALLDDPVKDWAAIIVYLALARRAGFKDGNCSATNTDIARWGHLSKAKVPGGIQTLERLGFITRVMGKLGLKSKFHLPFNVFVQERKQSYREEGTGDVASGTAAPECVAPKTGVPETGALANEGAEPAKTSARSNETGPLLDLSSPISPSEIREEQTQPRPSAAAVGSTVVEEKRSEQAPVPAGRSTPVVQESKAVAGTQGEPPTAPPINGPSKDAEVMGKYLTLFNLRFGRWPQLHPRDRATLSALPDRSNLTNEQAVALVEFFFATRAGESAALFTVGQLSFCWQSLLLLLHEERPSLFVLEPTPEEQKLNRFSSMRLVDMITDEEGRIRWDAISKDIITELPEPVEDLSDEARKQIRDNFSQLRNEWSWHANPGQESLKKEIARLLNGGQPVSKTPSAKGTRILEEAIRDIEASMTPEELEAWRRKQAELWPEGRS